MSNRTKKGHFKKGVGGRSALRNVKKFFPGVEEVTDATKTIDIEVTEKDAKRSKKYDHNGCALATACKDTMHLDGVVIAIRTAYLVRGKKAVRYQVPESASREIISFDRSGFFEPGTYQLKPPERPLGYKSPNEHSHSHKNTGTGESKAYRHHTGNIRAALGTKGI